MPLRKSTRVWLVVLTAATTVSIVVHRAVPDSGCLGILAGLVAALAACILLWRLSVAAFRLIVRRLTLRLAFSYFLIGIVPIPLLAALLSLAGYLVAHQYVANRLRREMTAVGEEAVRSGERLPEVAVDATGSVVASDVAWLPPGASAPWLSGLARPGFLVEGEEVWLAVREDRVGRAKLLHLNDPAAPWLQELADSTGYEVGVEVGSAERNESGITIDTKSRASGSRVGTGSGSETPAGEVERRPRGGPPPGGGLWKSEWVHAFYLETPLNAAGKKAGRGRTVAVLKAKTSPRTIFHQLFAQGVAEIGQMFRIAFMGLAATVLVAYLAALAVAFVLVGSIARNINRLTRATEAVARGDFSVRVNSRSRDQIGDLARSFDGMAASIQSLLQDTARKERLESEIAMARTIQHKLLPPTEASLEGVAVHAHFEPVAEIGGDYYDYLPMPDGRIAFALGDVSGHGLPTGLLVAMAKAALSSLLQAGHEGGDLFSRLNELIHRSTDPRHYMTLAVLAYDARARKAVLTNAGQLAPYRVSGSTVEPLSLPSFPLGLFPQREFPEREFSFSPGDLIVFLSDGFVEAVDGADDAFGFDRFESVLREHARSGAAALRDALLAAVAAHTGKRPAADDRTLLLLTVS